MYNYIISRLAPVSADIMSSSSSSSLIEPDLDAQTTSTDKLAPTCNAAKVHPLEKSKGILMLLIYLFICRPI